MFFVLGCVMLVGYWVITFGFERGLKKITNKGKEQEQERGRASENRVARVLGLYFRSTTENNSITVIVIY